VQRSRGRNTLLLWAAEYQFRKTTTIEALEAKFQMARNTAFCQLFFYFRGTNDNLEEIQRLTGMLFRITKTLFSSSTGNMLV